MNIELDKLLECLKKCILNGTFTKAQCVDDQTFICVKYNDASGLHYVQYTFEQLPKEWQDILKYRKAGEVIGHLKILAVFDIWPDAIDLQLPTIPKAS